MLNDSTVDSMFKVMHIAIYRKENTNYSIFSSDMTHMKSSLMRSINNHHRYIFNVNSHNIGQFMKRALDNESDNNSTIIRLFMLQNIKCL
jgi:hypothetical protein